MVSVKNITFKSSQNWFKIDNLGLLLLLTAIFSIVQLSYIHNIKLKLCAKRDVLSKKELKKNLMELETPPPPFMENSVPFRFILFFGMPPLSEKNLPIFVCQR